MDTEQIPRLGTDTIPLSLSDIQKSFKAPEAKLVLHGDSLSGKTCLLAALQGQGMQEHMNRTQHADLRMIQCTVQNAGSLDNEDYPPWKESRVQEELLDSSAKYISAAMWDFGGQMPFYQTQASLLKEAPTIFVIVLNGNKPVNESRSALRFWKDFATAAGCEASIVVVVTHMDTGVVPEEWVNLLTPARSLDVRSWTIAHYVSCKTGFGIARLRRALVTGMLERHSVLGDTSFPEPIWLPALLKVLLPLKSVELIDDESCPEERVEVSVPLTRWAVLKLTAPSLDPKDLIKIFEEEAGPLSEGPELARVREILPELATAIAKSDWDSQKAADEVLERIIKAAGRRHVVSVQRMLGRLSGAQQGCLGAEDFALLMTEYSCFLSLSCLSPQLSVYYSTQVAGQISSSFSELKELVEMAILPSKDVAVETLGRLVGLEMMAHLQDFRVLYKGRLQATRESPHKCVFMMPSAIPCIRLTEPPKVLLAGQVKLYLEPASTVLFLPGQALAEMMARLHWNLNGREIWKECDGMYIARFESDLGGWIEFYSSSPDLGRPYLTITLYALGNRSQLLDTLQKALRSLGSLEAVCSAGHQVALSQMLDWKSPLIEPCKAEDWDHWKAWLHQKHHTSTTNQSTQRSWSVNVTGSSGNGRGVIFCYERKEKIDCWLLTAARLEPKFAGRGSGVDLSLLEPIQAGDWIAYPLELQPNETDKVPALHKRYEEVLGYARVHVVRYTQGESLLPAVLISPVDGHSHPYHPSVQYPLDKIGSPLFDALGNLVGIYTGHDENTHSSSMDNIVSALH